MRATVAIAGAGMVGSYLYRLLQRSGISADIYGDDSGNVVCGLRPCGWGTTFEFSDRVRAAGLDPNEYILRRVKAVNFEGVDINARLMTFNKPKLVKDLLADATIASGRIPSGRYERVIDATGMARAYLPPVEDQVLIPCIQYRVRSDFRDNSKFVIRYGNIGYSWSFPLAGNEFHIGAGSLLESPKEMLSETGFPESHDSIICRCAGTVRTSAPDRCLPFVAHNPYLRCTVWGVGESVGVVGPITGEGVGPGLASAKLLLENWDDPERYTARLLRSFSWMTGERTVIDRVWRKERLTIADWAVLRGTGKRMGSEVSLAEVRSLLRCLNKYARKGERASGEKAEGGREGALITMYQ